MTEHSFLDANYWRNRYQSDETGWDLGAVSSPLKTFIDQLTNKEILILINNLKYLNLKKLKKIVHFSTQIYQNHCITI
jgi:hypothetical protein